MNNPEILTSIGTPGLEMRTFNRLYWNSRWPITDCASLNRAMRRAKDAIGDPVTRVVGRFICDTNTLAKILESAELTRHIEAIVPIHTWEGEVVSHMVMGAVNDPSRSALSTTPEMMELAIALRTQQSPKNPADRIAGMRQSSIRIVTQISEEMIEQMYSLWGPIFGWDSDRGEIENLSDRLQREATIEPKNRSVWFAGAMLEKSVSSLAMAERLDLTNQDGTTVPIIESTEWCAKAGSRLRGMTAAVTIHLHAQVISDLRYSPLPPLIIAETNLLSRAFYVGDAAAMIVPPQPGEIKIPQVLIQNVAVGDGLEPSGLRDFAVMYLPPTIMQQQYHQQALQEILQRV